MVKWSIWSLFNYDPVLRHKTWQIFWHLLLTTRFPAAGSFNLSCPRRLASWLKLGCQVSSTTDHLYSSCIIQHTEDLSTMRAEPARVKNILQDQCDFAKLELGMFEVSVSVPLHCLLYRSQKVMRSKPDLSMKKITTLKLFYEGSQMTITREYKQSIFRSNNNINTNLHFFFSQTVTSNFFCLQILFDFIRD